MCYIELDPMDEDTGVMDVIVEDSLNEIHGSCIQDDDKLTHSVVFLALDSGEKSSMSHIHLPRKIRKWITYGDDAIALANGKLASNKKVMKMVLERVINEELSKKLQKTNA